MKGLLIAVSSLVLLFLVSADIPVHCEYQQTLGKWKLQLTADNYDSSVLNSVCQMKSNLPPVASEYTVTLSEPNVVTDEKGNKGTWTMIYDEGFELVVGGKKFFAFFNFTTHWGKATSHCDETFTGTYHDAVIGAKKYGCFRGNKIQAEGEKKAKPFVHIPVPPRMELLSRSFRNNQTLIDSINKSQKLWTAKAYPEFEGKSYAEILRKSGRIVPGYKRAAHKKHMEYMRKYREQKVHKTNDLPTKWDWRNVNGVNYVSPVRDQGMCGSCYAFGTLAMFESHVRILTNNTKQPVFSPQNIVSCSRYSQGCDGGLEFLVSKYGEDFGVVLEKCEPYEGSDSKCNNRCAADDVTRITKYEFVGGYYGACNEQEMLDDLVNQGPVVVGFEVYEDFYNYGGGIYHHTGLEDPSNRFEAVNHAVLVVGYGVSGNTKYWIVKNSWGSGWGLNGFFMIVRGKDECSIESEASIATPVV